MAFYNNSKEVRKQIVKRINDDILADTNKISTGKYLEYYEDQDTYVSLPDHFLITFVSVEVIQE